MTKETFLVIRASLADALAAGGPRGAALRGAGLASVDPGLLTEAFDARLHEPYSAATAPLLGAVRASLPSGAAAATLPGSGPTVIVWAR